MAYDPRAHWGRLIGASVAVLAAALLLPRVVPAPTLVENRELAEAPPPPRGLAGLAAYRRGMDAYVADRFPPRAHLIGALNRLRLAVGVSGSPQVIVGRKGWLFYEDGSHLGASRGTRPLSDKELRVWLEGLAGRTEAMGAQGKAYVVLSPPEKDSIYPGLTPAWHDLNRNRPAVTMSRLARISGAGRVLYLQDQIAPYAHWGMKTYEPNETHWTGLGAYLGYAALMRDLQAQGVGQGPRPLAAFREIPDDERIVPRNLAVMLGVADFVPIDHPDFEDPMMRGRLRTTWLSQRRDWTAPRVIDTGQAGKPVLLMTMDSFSTALLPFLYGEFSRVVLAHNHDGVWRADLIARFNPDVVVTEMLESGLSQAMVGSPPASPQAAARVAQVVHDRRRYLVPPPPKKVRPGALTTRQGGDGDDRLVGGDGPDRLQGRKGADTLNGLGGDDILFGGRGPDVIDGGDGADQIFGDRDDDTLKGGAGPDVFHTYAGAGTDVVLDFSAAEGDQVMVDGGGAYTLRQAGADTVVEMAGARMILRGVRLDELPGGWIGVSGPLAPGG